MEWGEWCSGVSVVEVERGCVQGGMLGDALGLGNWGGVRRECSVLPPHTDASPHPPPPPPCHATHCRWPIDFLNPYAGQQPDSGAPCCPSLIAQFAAHLVTAGG